MILHGWPALASEVARVRCGFLGCEQRTDHSKVNSKIMGNVNLLLYNQSQHIGVSALGTEASHRII